MKHIFLFLFFNTYIIAGIGFSFKYKCLSSPGMALKNLGLTDFGAKNYLACFWFLQMFLFFPKIYIFFSQKCSPDALGESTLIVFKQHYTPR